MGPIYKYDLTQCYFEMARAVLTKWNVPKNTLGNQWLENKVYQFSLTVVSVTVIYSCLAIEAYVRWHLHKIWEESRNSSGKQYSQFYKKYGKADFPKLTKKLLPSLEQKMNMVCDSYQISRIKGKDPQLWKDFKKLLKETRNFMVHPNPGQDFHKYVKLAQEDTGLPKWSKIAERVISYFLVERGKQIPSWLRKNQFFAIKEFDVLLG